MALAPTPPQKPVLPKRPSLDATTASHPATAEQQPAAKPSGLPNSEQAETKQALPAPDQPDHTQPTDSQTPKTSKVAPWTDSTATEQQTTATSALPASKSPQSAGLPASTYLLLLLALIVIGVVLAMLRLRTKAPAVPQMKPQPQNAPPLASSPAKQAADEHSFEVRI